MSSMISITYMSATIFLSIAFYILAFSNKYQFSLKSPKKTRGGYPILGAIQFFTSRWDFMRHAAASSSTGNFSFFLGKYPVVALSGRKGREVFFESRELGFTEGYSVLFGQAPAPAGLQENGTSVVDKDFSGPGGYFARRITRMLKTENFNKSLPKLMKDVQACLNRLADDPSGITDPYESVYRIVYQLTIRIVGCDDIADDPELLEKTLRLYETIEKSATPTAILFPWFPSLGIIKRTYSGGRLYMIIKRIVDARNESGARGDDPLQFLIDQGDDIRKIIEFIIGALFAGLLNSGINAAFVLANLAKNPYWMSKVREEVQTVAAKYSKDESAPLTEQLSHVPIEAWESEFPNLDLCLKDSIRLTLLGAAFRKNIGGREIPIGDEVIPPGAYVTYATGDIHLNPNVYRDPEKWDPSRYLPDRAEDKKVPHGWMGWGLGRHPCLGMRFAKLEQNIITAFFLAKFDYNLTDKKGNPLAEVPAVDFNGHSAHKPKVPIYFKYNVREH